MPWGLSIQELLARFEELALKTERRAEVAEAFAQEPMPLMAVSGDIGSPRVAKTKLAPQGDHPVAGLFVECHGR